MSRDLFPGIDLDFENFVRIDIDLVDKDGNQSDIKNFIQPICDYIETLSRLEDTVDSPTSLLFSKTLARLIHIPDGSRLIQRDPEAYISIWLFVGMLVASLLEEEKLTPKKKVSPITMEDLGLLRKEIDQMILEIQATKDSEIEELNAQYALFTQLISEAIDKHENSDT